MGISPDIFEKTKTDRLIFSDPLLTGTSDVTPKAFHISEIPVNNVTYMTESLAVCQTCQNPSSFFQHTSLPNFVTDFVCRLRKLNQSTRDQSTE